MSLTNQARRLLVTAGLIAVAGAGLAVQASTAQASSPQTDATSSTTLNPGPPPTSFNSSQRKSALGTISTANGITVTVNVAKAGRYSVELDNVLPTVVTTTVDGAKLQPTSLDFYDKEWTQTFSLSSGTHVFRLGASSTQGSTDAFLFGTF